MYQSAPFRFPHNSMTGDPASHRDDQEVALATLAWQTEGRATDCCDRSTGEEPAMRRWALVSAVLILTSVIGGTSSSHGQSPAEYRADGRVCGRAPKQGRRVRVEGRSAVEPGRDQLGAARAQARRRLGARHPGLHQVRQVVPRCERRVRPHAGRQARRGHHGHRPDGRRRAQDRRRGDGQSRQRLSRQERPELRGDSDGDRRA